MSSTLKQAVQSPEVPSLDGVRLKMAKVVSNCPPLREVIERALEGNGPVKATAATMNKDRSQMRREAQSGTTEIRDLETLGADFYVNLAKEILEIYGPLSTPQAVARQDIRDIRRLLDRLEQLLEYVA